MFVYEPSGPHRVGAFDLLTDRGRSGILARIFYPAEAASPGPAAAAAGSGDAPDGVCGVAYTEPEYVQGLLDFLRWGRWLRRLVGWASSRLRLCCDWRGRLLPVGQHQFPLVIFSHGLGGQRHIYSAICLDLASHGFVVAAVEHRDGSASASFYLRDDGATRDWLPYDVHVLSDFPYRNRQVNQRAAEVLQLTDTMLRLHRGQEVVNCMTGFQGPESMWLLKQFEGRIDANRVHVVGHSFGGATALTAAIIAPDGLYRTCSVHDIWMHPVDPELYRKLCVPVLFLNNQVFHWETNVKRIKAVLESPGLQTGMSTILTIRGTNHAAQSDSGLYIAPWLSKRMGLSHALEPKEAIQLSSRVTRLFIARHEGLHKLTEDEEELLNGDTTDVCFPDFTFEADTPRHN